MFCCAVVVMASCDPYRIDSQNMSDAFETAKLVYGNGESDTLLFIPELDKVSGYFAQKRQYGKAALAALYYGYSELGFDNAAAMESLLMAEQYGVLANDSLTVARAQYQEGKMLVDDYMHEDAIVVLSNSIQCFGYHYEEKALAQNAVACCYMLLGEYDSAMVCLDRSLDYAEKGNSDLARRKTWNNYAVLYRLLGDHEQGIECLRKVSRITDTDKSTLFLMNMGKAFLACGAMDSATYYFRDLERELNNANACDETVVTAYDALSDFAERQGDYMKALEYEKQVEQYIGIVRDRIEQRNVYRIQQRYDYGKLQNDLDKKIIRKRHVIMLLILVLAVILGFSLVLYYRYVQKKLHEAELSAVLLRFMNQNRELLKQNDEQKKKNDIVSEQLSSALSEKLKAMQKLHIFLKNRKDITALTDLEKQLFGGHDHWEVMLGVIHTVYPGLFERIKDEYPMMNELEQKVFLLSRFKLSRPDEAAILGVSTSVLDKARGRVRKLTAH